MLADHPRRVSEGQGKMAAIDTASAVGACRRCHGDDAGAEDTRQQAHRILNEQNEVSFSIILKQAGRAAHYRAGIASLHDAKMTTRHVSRRNKIVTANPPN